ncbi:MAG: hypothetical protein ACJ780_31810 [Solirubrobacteraceae bacterium]
MRTTSRRSFARGLIRRHGADLRFGELKSLGHKVILALSQAG